MKLGEFIKHRKGFITIDDNKEYKLCRVQVHRKGVVLREIIPGSQIKTKKQQICKGGDFLVAEMDAKVGGYGFVPEELDGAIVSSHYFLFEVDSKRLRPKYLEIISKLMILQDQIKAVGSTNYAAIRPANVLNWEIPHVPIERQKEIEQFHDVLSGKGQLLVDELNKQLDLVKQLRQSFLREAMQGKLVRQDKKDGDARDLLKKIKAEKTKAGKREKPLPEIKPEEIPFEIPGNWVWCRLGEVADIKRGKSPKYSDQGVAKMLNQKCIRWYVIDIQFAKFIDQKWLDSITNDFKLLTNDILVNSTGEGTIGRSAIVENVVAGFAYDSHLLRIRSNISQKYICYFINSEYGQSFINDAKGATSTKQTELGVNNLSNLIIPVPPIQEQSRIINALEKIMKYCDALESSIQSSKEQNEMLLQVGLREVMRG